MELKRIYTRTNFFIMTHQKEILDVVEHLDDIWELCNPLFAYVAQLMM